MLFKHHIVHKPFTPVKMLLNRLRHDGRVSSAAGDDIELCSSYPLVALPDSTTPPSSPSAHTLSPHKPLSHLSRHHSEDDPESHPSADPAKQAKHARHQAKLLGQEPEDETSVESPVESPVGTPLGTPLARGDRGFAELVP
jgi:hypothetical protein